jgi:hypothetical protein
MKIDSSTFNDFVKNAKVMWRMGYERVAPVAKQLYDVSMSQELTSEHSSLDGFTFAKRKTEGDDYYQENPTQNYSKTMTKYRVGLMATITWEMRTYDKYREIKRVLTGLGEAAAQRMELDLTHRFTFGTATTYVDMDGETVSISVGDGYQLFYATHTVNGSSTTYRNRIANNPAFSKGGLEAAEKLFATQMIDSSGNKVVITPDTIVTTDDPNTVNLVKEYLFSTADPDGAHSGVFNNYKSKYKHIILPYLATSNVGAYDSTKAKYWMLAAASHTDAILEISENPHLVSPTPGSNAEDFDNDDWKFKASAAYGIVITDPKWVVMSSGDGAA